MQEHLVVEYVPETQLERFAWTEKRNAIAKAFCELTALSPDKAVTLKGLAEKLPNAGDLANLKKNVLKMPGVVTVIPTIYRSTVPYKYYYLTDFYTAAVQQNHANFYPVSMAGFDIPSKMLVKPQNISEANVLARYRKEYLGQTTVASNSESSGKTTVVAPPVPNWLKLPEGEPVAASITVEVPPVFEGHVTEAILNESWKNITASDMPKEQQLLVLIGLLHNYHGGK